MPNTKNSAINLSVLNNLDGFTLSSQSSASGRALSIISGNVTLQGGGPAISNGQLLIGNASGNSMDVSNLVAGTGLLLTAGPASLRLDIIGGSFVTGISGILTNVINNSVNIYPDYSLDQYTLFQRIFN